MMRAVVMLLCMVPTLGWAAPGRHEAGKNPIVFLRSPLEITTSAAPPEPAEAAEEGETGGEAGLPARRTPPGNRNVNLKHTLSVEVHAAVADHRDMLADLKQHSDRTGLLWVYEAERPARLDASLLTEASDIVAIGKNGVVQQTLSAVPPEAEDLPDYAKPPYAVLFLKQGNVARMGIRPGDKVRHRIFEGGTLVEHMVRGQTNVQTGPVIFQSR